MKRTVVAIILFSIGALTLVLAHCGDRVSSNNGYIATSAPGLIHVTNGSTLGFYTSTGDYGFESQERSIFPLGNSWGNTQPFAQNTITGMFYFTTNNPSLGNAVFYLNAVNGGYAFGTLSGSQFNLAPRGSSLGVAFSLTSNLIYVTDPINDVVTYINSNKISYGIGGNSGNSIFASPLGYGANFINVAKNSVIVTETQVGSAYFMDANTGSPIPAVGKKISLPLVSASTPCNSASLVSEVQVNPTNSTAFVLCGASVIYINMATRSPNYFYPGGLVPSTIATTGITSPKDIVYDSGDNTVIIVGGTKIISLDARTGALAKSLDVSTYKCGSSIGLAGVAYSLATKQIYVTDSANSQIYVLGSSGFELASGECSTSVFSTGDVPGPTKIGFF